VLEQTPSAVAVSQADGSYILDAVSGQPFGMAPLVSASKPGYFAGIRFAEPEYRPISKDTQVDFSLEPLSFISLGEVVRAHIGGAV